MRSKSLWILLFTAVIAAAGPLRAQEQQPGGGLAGVLSDLLRTGEAENKRVPFGREEIQLSFAPLVRQTAPAVVNVYASQQARSPFRGDPFFERFFGSQMPPRFQSSLGSGVLVDPAGFVVTNNHVIANADQVKVATPDGREFESTVLLKDESVDLAVLKIEADEPFPTVGIGNSDALEVGDLVLAIGNPFGVGQTTTSGIVSALARSHIGVSDFGFFIQTDAAINPGNSGGPLIDMHGQLVGINTAIFSKSGGSIGIGFAIPSNIVRAVVEAAKNGLDYFERPYLGATFQAVTPQMAEALGMDRPRGALVASVAEDGPAAKAGLQPGDVITAMNDAQINSVDALGYRIATQPIGSEARLTVLRDGTETALEVALERAPEGESARQVVIGGRSPMAGSKVAAVSPRLAQRLGLPTEAKGVAVVDVDPDSPAAGFFRPKDIVREVNGEPISSAEQLEQVAQMDTRFWRVTIERNGQVIRQILRY